MPINNNINNEILNHFISDQSELETKSGSWEINLLTNELIWSDGIYKIIERTSDTKKLTSISELEIIHPDDLDFVLKKKKEALENGTEYRVKKRIITDTNKIKHIFSFGKVIFDQDNHPIKFIGIYLDITEYVEIEEKNKLVDKLSKDVIYEWDIVKDEYTLSEGFKNFINYELPKNKIGINEWKEFIHPLDFKNEDENWIQFINNPNASEWIKEFRFKRNKNSYTYIEETAILIRNSNNQPMKMIGIIKDISTKKTVALQKKLQSEISNIFQTEEKFETILDYVTKSLVKNGSFLGAEIWLTKSNNEKIILKQNFYVNNKHENLEYSTQLKKGEGFAGKIWNSQKSRIWSKNEIIENPLNQFNYKSQNINSVLGIPLLKNDTLIGSLLLFSEEDFEINPYQTNAYLSLSEFLGAEIDRKIKEDKNQLLIKNAPDIIAIANNKGYFTKVNPAFCKLLGYTENEITSKPFVHFLHPEDINPTLDEYSESILGQKIANNFINRYRTKDGNYKWISWNSSEIFEDENYNIAYGRDISEVKELEILFHDTAKLAEIGSWGYDISENENPIYLSKVAKEILELDEKSNISLNFLLNLTDISDRKKTKTLFQQLILHNKNFDIEFKIITPKNNYKWIRCIGKVQHNNLKRNNKIVGSIQNITKQKTNELKLAERNVILSSITDVTTELMHSNNWYESLYKTFIITGNTINVDRIYYFEIDNYDSGIKTCSQKLEWVKKDIKAQINNSRLQYLPLNEISDFYKQLVEGKIFYGITSKLKKGNFKLIMESQDIQSFLIYPVILNNNLLGFIGFDDCSNERIWSDTEISFLSNITYNLTASLQRKIYNLELEKSLQEKNKILDSIDDAFIYLETDWTVNYWNKKAEKLSEIKREKIIGKKLWDLFPHLIGTTFEKNLTKAFKRKKSILFQNHFAELDIWLEISVYPSNTGLSVYFKDITQTKKYETELKQSNDRFEKSMQATNDAIWDWDIVNNTIYRGEGFYKQFGYDLPKSSQNENLLGLFKERLKPKKADKLIESIIKAINDPSVINWKKDHWYKKQDGKYAYVSNNAIVIRDKNKKAIRIVGAIQDITYRKKQQKALLKLNKKLESQAKSLIKTNQELEHFAYVASHDLQEPLRMVTSFLTQLEKKYNHQLDEKGKQYINFAVDGAKRMRDLIKDILEYSKISKLEETYELVNVNEIINEVYKTNDERIVETNAKILYSNLPVIKTSRFPLSQIFQNLIGNALKYQKQNNQPEITINAIEDEKNWTFKISDNGIGIENEYIDKIFVIFQRLHDKKEYGGNGMGLAIVKKLVENLNGKITVESEINKVTTFYLTLPKNEKI
ncbi:PAS domain-containing protein [Flavobacterium sp.]|uniref:PAS domain-containing protein n=5 Tax=Flavobacterium sp. TaxID=239 RepID=UPI004047979D